MRVLTFILIVLLVSTANLDLTDKRTASKMVEASEHFLSLVPDGQMQSVLFDFETDERTHWNFVPMTGKRKGMALEDMTDDQRVALHQLLQAALSTEGYLKVTSIQQLERLLGELENRPDYRNPGYYYLSFFGRPSMEGAWGWRFEGHHLSINFSIVDGQIAATPTFMGTNPGRVKNTVYAGLEILSTEITLARQLMQSMDSQQQSRAIISDEAPREIVTGNSRVALLDRFEGLSYNDMEPSQQDLLVLLISTYIHNLEPDIAAIQLERINDKGLEKLHFAWAGSLQEGDAHYYRIHGPNVLIEYDNTQNNANHVHSVWRDLENDFGRDYLKSHYEEHHDN